MSLRIAAAVAALLLGEAVDPAISVRADDKAATAKKTAAAKTSDKAEKGEFGSAKCEIQAKLRSKLSIERVAGFRQLHGYPNVEAAKLLVTAGLRDDDPSVRDAAYHTLLDLNDNADIARYLLLTVNKDVRHGVVNQTTFRLLAVLLASTSPDIVRDVTAYLEKQTGKHDGLVLVESLADDLGEHGQVEGVGPLSKLVALKSFSAEFGLRRAIAEALMKISVAEAIGQLVALLEKVQGEIRAEIVKHLCEATGQDLGMETAPWRQWWKDNEKTLQMAAAAMPRQAVNNFTLSSPSLGGARYYGLSICADKMVFILDTSASMLQGGLGRSQARVVASDRWIVRQRPIQRAGFQRRRLRLAHATRTGQRHDEASRVAMDKHARDGQQHGFVRRPGNRTPF